MTFSEEVLDLGYDYGAAGGPQFSITNTVSGGGFEKANLDWSQPLGEWRIGDKTGQNCLIQTEYNDLYHFWMARRGSFEGFRFKDWGDFELTDELIGVGDGIRTQFQITKTYGSFVRIVKKIDINSNFYTLLDGGFSSAVLAPNTGILTFGSAPAVGQRITVNGAFHVPVRFVESTWPGKFYATKFYEGGEERWYELGPLSVRAIRV